MCHTKYEDTSRTVRRRTPKLRHGLNKIWTHRGSEQQKHGDFLKAKRSMKPAPRTDIEIKWRGDEMHHYVFVGMRVCLCLMMIIKEGLGGMRRNWKRTHYISIPMGQAGDRQHRRCVPGLCCQRRGVSTCDWTTDTGINSSAAELRADQWEKVLDALQRLHFLQRKSTGGFDQYPLCEGCRHGRLMAI